MADETTAAIQALIKQVGALTETVEKQNKQIDDQNTRLDGLHEFNGRVLDQKKDLERKFKASPETIADMAKMGYEPGKDGDWYPKGTQPTHRLTREEARDPQKYRAAKEAAAKAGTQLQIVDPTEPDDMHRRASRSKIDASLKTTLIRDDDQKVAYMRRDAMASDARQYRQLRADGMTVQQWSNADDLPQHMQTKLALMEKSNDA
jgi:CRISPR/Cas system-associated endonuclease/helicase Cas3